MQHKGPGNISVQRLHTLFVSSGAKRHGPDGLSFSTCKKRRTMHPRKEPDLTGDIPNLVKAAAVNTLSLF